MSAVRITTLACVRRVACVCVCVCVFRCGCVCLGGVSALALHHHKPDLDISSARERDPAVRWEWNFQRPPPLPPDNACNLTMTSPRDEGGTVCVAIHGGVRSPSPPTLTCNICKPLTSHHDPAATYSLTALTHERGRVESVREAVRAAR